MAKEKIKDIPLDVQAAQDYYLYGTATIEDRAIVGAIDGVKPVMRRIVWALHSMGLSHTHKHEKAAKGVGETMGNYHPHGDTSIFDAMVKAANHTPMPLIDGYGNWGTMTSGNGAMRYINMRLSKYADKVFFDRFYLSQMKTIPNYDGSRQEPLNLIALLPNGLLNGNFGICPGVNTRTPAFTLPSLVKVLKEALKQDKCTHEMCKDLEWISNYGGRIAKSSKNKSEVKRFFKTGKANIDWESVYTDEPKLNAIRITKFAPFSTEEEQLQKLIASVEEIKGVQSVDSDGEKTDPYKVAYRVRFVKTLKGSARDKAIKAVMARWSSRLMYNVMVTDRSSNEIGDVQIKLRTTTVPQLITEWVTYRKQLEKDACAARIVNINKEIRWHEVMRLAIDKLDLIFRLVKDKKLTDEQVVNGIAKGIKVSEEEAEAIFSRQLRQLRKLEDTKLVDGIKKLKEERKQMEGRIKKPAAYVATHLDSLLKELS